MDTETGRSMDTETFLTLDELALRLKVKKSWIYSRTRESGPNSIPRIKIGKYLRFNWQEVRDWLVRENDENKR